MTKVVNYRRHARVLLALGTAALPVPGQSLASAQTSRPTPAVPVTSGARTVPVTTRAVPAPAPAAAPAPGSAPHEPQPPAAKAPQPPAAQPVVTATPTQPLTGTVVRLRVQNAAPGSGQYTWDLDGTGRYSTDTGRSASVRKVYRDPGPRVISVHVRDAAGTQIGSLKLFLGSRHRARRLAVVVMPGRLVAGSIVGFRAVGGSAATIDYRRDLDGSGRYLTNTGHAASVANIYRAAGVRRASVRVTNRVGNHQASVKLLIHGAIHPAQARQNSPRSPSSTRRVTLHAHAAADPGVSIADFAFAPSTTTVHAGDTITWTNNGPSSHTATAKDGSFDTGVLPKGQSGSHTFTQPGTFSYFCKIHAFMHGTIVVLASTPPATHSSPRLAAPAGAPAPTRTTPQSSPTTASAPSLPLTGLDLASVLVVGLVFTGLGVALRRVTTRG